ncbi:MAG: hypothetical protein GXX98_03955 [Planctomycetes bacterium]|jgi:hypothetical protein|nr:hypothetical protein [Planctomycetota bacterium]
MMNDRRIVQQVASIRERIDDLGPHVQRIARAVEAESKEAWDALRRYPRCRGLLKRILSNAAVHQHKAMAFGRQLEGAEAEIERLQRSLQFAVFHAGGPTPETVALAGQIDELQQLVHQYSAPQQFEPDQVAIG